MNISLWQETMEFLKEWGRTFEDVIAIFGVGLQITKENFKEIAQKTNKDLNIAGDLIILGRDFIIKREDLGLKGQWVYIPIPSVYGLSKEIKNVKTLGTKEKGWKSLKELNEIRN